MKPDLQEQIDSGVLQKNIELLLNTPVLHDDDTAGKSDNEVKAENIIYLLRLNS